jgi:hypothetical protein
MPKKSPLNLAELAKRIDAILRDYRFHRGNPLSTHLERREIAAKIRLAVKELMNQSRDSDGAVARSAK